jgi:hypothetical protein
MPGNKSIQRTCGSCRKSLPKCSLCLLPMGLGVWGTKGVFEGSVSGRGESAFDSWFTWCVKCGHGGHSKHVLEWFEGHNACAVSGCGCKCRVENR